MSKKLFTDNEMKILSKNPYVTSVSPKGITYSNEFKRLFISENEKGKLPRQIFEENGLDIDIIGKERLKSAAKRWRKTYKEFGVVGFQDARVGSRGKAPRELTQEEKYARLEAQNHLLKAENELLKKIDLAERRMEEK